MFQLRLSRLYSYNKIFSKYTYLPELKENKDFTHFSKCMPMSITLNEEVWCM